MGLLSAVKRAILTAPADGPQALFPVADCERDCDSCLGKFPSTVKIERNDPLWGSVKPWRRHILVATGKTDWAHSGADEPKSLVGKLEQWDQKESPGRVSVSNSSMPPPEEYVTAPTNALPPTNMLVLPLCLEAHNVTHEDAIEVARTLTAIDSPDAPVPETIGSATVSKVAHFAVILLCSHRTRDKRCGVTAPILKKEFEHNLRDHGLLRDATDSRPGGVPIYFINHVGGHKYAGNVIIYRSNGEGIWLGRVEPKHVKAIVEETVLHGRVFPEQVRGGFVSDW
ncbi:Sucraseferredoxin-like protein [Dipodascopsis tothii]|uniref:Sucraseferredoxin-like protein n=1 Tax=Dipodascopsis tothii TaxID=44089 RepID=UPI0034CF4025